MNLASRLRRCSPYICTLILATGLYALTQNFPAGRPGTLGPAFWPRVAIALMAIAAIFEATRIFFGRSIVTIDIIQNDEEDDAPRQPLRLAGGLLLVVLYAMSVTTLGYLLASFLFLVTMMYLGGFRNHRIIWTSSVLGILAIAFIFLKVVYVSLPRGIAPFDGFTQQAIGLLGIR